MTEKIPAWGNCKYSNKTEENLASITDEEILFHTCNNQKMVELMETLKKSFSMYYEITEYGANKWVILEERKGIEPIACSHCKFYEEKK